MLFASIFTAFCYCLAALWKDKRKIKQKFIPEERSKQTFPVFANTGKD